MFLVPRFYSTVTDPLVHRGRHFGRTVFAFANARSLIMNGLERMADEDAPDLVSLSTKYELSLMVVYY